MCGRFVSRTDAAMERAFNLIPRQWRPDWQSFNIAPSQPVPVVLQRDAQREGWMARWGLIPPWCHGEPPKFSTFNARAENLSKAASFRKPWQQGQRCLIPALGFYEWQQQPGGGKQPYLIRRRGGEIFAFGGLWETSRRADGTQVLSCTVITLPANALVAAIHAKQRMPLMLSPEQAGAWLDADITDAEAMLQAYPEADMEAWPVSTRVNRVGIDDESLLDPV
jgi:putative SOS response-associated peptidase YedK